LTERLKKIIITITTSAKNNAGGHNIKTAIRKSKEYFIYRERQSGGTVAITILERHLI